MKNYKAQRAKTGKIIAEMLKENTGIAMMDSGGDDGRAWQWRQKIENFDNLPYSKVEFSTYGNDDDRKMCVEYSKEIYHFLVENCEYDPQWDKLFQKFCKKNKEDKDLSGIEMFLEKDNLFQYLSNKSKLSAFEAEVFGELESNEETLKPPYFANDPFTENSYNFETVINGTIQWGQFEYKNNNYVILQIHGGADVRGGYTNAKVFCLNEPESFVSSIRDGNIYAGDDFRWFTDDGCNWYSESIDDNVHDSSNFPNLEELPFTEVFSEPGRLEELEKLKGQQHLIIFNKQAWYAYNGEKIIAS